MLGGLLVVGVVSVVAWWPLPSTKTVIVEDTQIGPATTVSRHPGALTARQIYEQDSAGVVFVNALGINKSQSSSEYFKGEGGQQTTATGSGFEVDGAGTILTDWHVVADAAKITIGLEHNRTVEASIVGKDPSHDIAVLRIPTVGLTLHPLPLGDSSKTRVGDPVLAIGNPFGLVRTLTTGVVSALERQIESPNGRTISGALQTDAPINPGNSGGPLLNEHGAVIGINSQIETSGEHGGNVGIAFAIPIDTVKGRLLKLEKGR
jgi:S1-C subfamily serine protease